MELSLFYNNTSHKLIKPKQCEQLKLYIGIILKLVSAINKDIKTWHTLDEYKLGLV